MRLLLGLLAMFVLLTGSAYAQSPQISNWTVKSYSEEDYDIFDLGYVGVYVPFTSYLWYRDGLRGEDNTTIEFISGIMCSGRYCDNKNFKTVSGIPVYPNKTPSGPSSERVVAAIAGHEADCPPGMYIYSMSCEGDYCGKVAAQCARPKLAVGTKAACGFKKTISDEGASRKENEVTLATYQLFNGYKCEGKNCDNLTMSWCNIYGGEKDHLSLALKGARWKKVGDMIGGEKQISYTSGLERSTGSSDTVEGSVEVSASATIEAEASVGFGSVTAGVTAGVAVTAGYAREWNRSEASSSQVTVNVQCNKFESGGTRADIYAFSLLAENKLVSADADFEAVTGTYACAYGKSDVPAPACLPTQCDNSFATNCQKCSGLHMSASLGQAPTMVKTLYSGEEEEEGSFVEFYGRWTWKDTKVRPARTSRLALYNDMKRSNQYTLCQDSKCTLMDGDYIKLRDGAELVLTAFFREDKSEIVFTSSGDGVVTGEYWHDATAGGEPDGKIELRQL
jgi:hypothetical protein